MLPSSSDRMQRARAERMLVVRIAIAVGLALLLVVGAWSTSHGSADVHASLCLAPGVAHPAGSSASGEQHDGASAVDVLSSDAALCVIAVLCGVALALLFLRLRGATGRALGGLVARPTSPPRADPARLLPALTLTQLSLSRT